MQSTRRQQSTGPDFASVFAALVTIVAAARLIFGGLIG